MTKNEAFTLSIAVIALLFSIWQGREQIKHNHISVEPRINSYFSNCSDDCKNSDWGIYLINNGMGTAFVNDLEVFIDGRPMPNHEYGKFYEAIIALKLNPLCFLVGNPRPNDSFQVGSEKFLIKFREDSPSVCLVQKVLFRKYQKDRLNYRLTIESIYDDKFVYNYSENKQVRYSGD